MTARRRNDAAQPASSTDDATVRVATDAAEPETVRAVPDLAESEAVRVVPDSVEPETVRVDAEATELSSECDFSESFESVDNADALVEPESQDVAFGEPESEGPEPEDSKYDEFESDRLDSEYDEPESEGPQSRDLESQELESAGPESEGVGSEESEGAAEHDDEDEDYEEGAEEEPGFARVVRPRVTVRWPRGLAAPLHERPPGELSRPLRALDALAEILGTMFADTGAGSLFPDGVRWSPEHGWQLLVTPPYDTRGSLYTGIGSFDEFALQVGWRRDQQSLAIALTQAAFGRRPADAGEIRRLADLTAGALPFGFDALVNLLLRDHARAGDTGPLRALAEAFGRRPVGALMSHCYVETGVGSKKAKGRGEYDNEDVALTGVAADGHTRVGLFDGATGDGDGSGRTAAMAARDRVMATWQPGVAPARLLHEADAAVSAATRGCTTAILVNVERTGRAELAAVGDSSAWLLRRSRADGFHAWRLTPSHTAYAAALRASASARGGYSELTHYLGGAAAEPFTAEFAVCPGDLLVLASDGAAVATARHEWFGDVLARLAAEHVRDDRPLGAAIAADLVARSEQHGGFDNATALVVQFQPF